MRSCIAVGALAFSTLACERSGTIPPGSATAVSGEAVPGLEPFDELFTSFLAEHGIPGASVAISRGGDVVYARGFGEANIESGEIVQPDSLFRIASLSKPITATAIMQLVEQERISLDDNPFAVLGYAEALRRDGVDLRLRQITIRNVLQHTAGWDHAKSFDPMFQYARIAREMGVSAPPAHQAIIEFMLGRPLDFDPGARYAYSNFGYCVLGRVVEAVSGMTYERYAQEHVLKPVGVTRMRIGESLPEQRADGEVVYYDRDRRVGRPIHDLERQVPFPYRIDHAVMDSHGAWIASAADLVRFANAFNDPGASVLLRATSIELMFTPPAGSAGHDDDGDVRSSWYGFGWLVRPAGDSENTWHNGRINGTSSLLVRRHDGLNWAVLFNTDLANDGSTPAGLVDGLMHRAARKADWPE